MFTISCFLFCGGEGSLHNPFIHFFFSLLFHVLFYLVHSSSRFCFFSFLYSYSSAGIPIAPQIFWPQVIKIGQHPFMAPKKAMKTKTSPKTPWNPRLLAQMCRQGTNQKPPDDFDTFAKVLCGGDLLHGLDCTWNSAFLGEATIASAWWAPRS